MKTKEELTVLKNEFEALNRKLATLSEEELKAIAGGRILSCSNCPRKYDCPTEPSKCEFLIVK